MLLAEVAETSRRVAATRARTAKVTELAALLARLDPPEVVPAVGFLTGDPRQGRVGVGWATLASLEAPPAVEPSLTVLDVDGVLGQVAGTSGAGSVARRLALLTGVFARATADEQSFLRRLLLGDLEQGALEGVMADAVARAARLPAPAVRRAAMLTGDLAATAQLALAGGAGALAAVNLRVLRPVQPMLASTAGSVEEAVAGLGAARVEWKLDGARIQAHRRGDEVRLFTRNLNDVTERLGAVVDVVRSLPVEQVILDGEVLGAGDGERPDRFQETMSRFGRHTSGGHGLAAWFFDCLHLDGIDLLDRPLVDRLAVLDRVAPAWRIPGMTTGDPAEACRVLDEALAAGHEGVMVKAAASVYEAGRRGAAWRKVKPVRTLDLVVLGVEWGHGRRRGWLSNLHLGARDPATGGLVMVGKTFKGLTDELLRWQTERFLGLETHREGITVFVRPEQVVEVALDGVQASPRYPGGVALRFARVKRYRADKAAADADTIDAVRALLPGSA